MKSSILITLFTCLFALSTAAKEVVWFNGRQSVSYQFHGKRSPVIDTALDLFCEDIHQLTGKRPESHEGGILEIFELDKLKDKDFIQLQKRKIPIERIIAKEDAFYIGCQGENIVIVGSNAHGTAYGILELSRLAGVSPWIDWNDARPLRKQYLAMKSDFYTVQWPSVKKRGFYVSNGKFDSRSLTELLLRLRGNTLLHKLPAEDAGTKVLQLPERWLPCTQPGFIYHEMRQAYQNGATHEWMMSLDNPKVDAYQLSLFMDMAWNIDRINESNIQSHYGEWLTAIFGEHIGARLLPIMTEYYHLAGIRKPEQMNVEFAADAFGNELERYIDNYKDVASALTPVEKLIPEHLQDAYFATIKYPVYAAWAMATKQLQAQEARHIGRPESFLHDAEALQSAVRSWKAHEEIIRLTNYYNDHLAGGKWKGTLNIHDNPLILGEPQFPKKITKKEIEEYGKPDAIRFSLDTDNALVKNAANYRKAPKGSKPIQMLGHSMKAIALPRGESLSFSFYSESEADAILRIAVIPTAGDRRFRVNVDGEAYDFTETTDPHSSQGIAESNRGQVVKEIKMHLTRNSHDIDIQAIGDAVVVDQIMIDYNPYRIFYMFPIAPALH